MCVDEYLPLRTDSILLHPDTMKACGCVIAAPLVIRGRRNGGQGRERGYVCGKVWPLQSLPLDGKSRDCSRYYVHILLVSQWRDWDGVL